MLTDRQEHTIINALRVAAEQYDRDARTTTAKSLRMSDQFKRQAIEARELADKIENEGMTRLLK